MQIKTEKVKDYHVNIVLPSKYNAQNKYRTIYIHDGGNGAKQALNYLDHLIMSNQIEPIIIIGILPINRNNDYTPWSAPSLLPNVPELGGKLKDYLTIIVEEIKPYIDKNFATNPAPTHTAIAGCSFGGLASIFASYYYPDVFHHYIILSASFWYEDVLNYLNGEMVIRGNQSYQKPHITRDKHKMYLYVGMLEGIYRDSVQKHMVEYTNKAFNSIKKEGFDNGQLLFEQHPEGTHDHYFFSMHFIKALHWLYGNNKTIK